VFVNRYFAPDHSATSQILTELAAAIGEQDDVHVITGRQLYDDPKARLPARELHGNVTVHRVWTTRFGRGRLKLRALDYLTFYASALLKMLVVCRRGSVLVAKTDPPLLCVPAAAAAVLKRSLLVNWFQDVFPEIAARLGVMSDTGLAYRAISAARNFSLRFAGAHVVLGEVMAQRIADLGVDRAKIRVIGNWAVGQGSLAARGASLREEWGLGERFVVAYSGNLGRVHDVATMLEAAALLAKDPRILFLFIGSGAKQRELQEAVCERGLRNVMFKPYQPVERLEQSLAVADVHLVTLLPDLEGLVVPSKVYGALAAGRPVLFVGSARGEVARIIARAGCGFQVDPGDAVELARRMAELSADSALARRLGVAARAAHDNQHRFEHALQSWRSLLDGAALGAETGRRARRAY
jgi:glycosyltransferase involved in cell wall biosynthesis